MSGGYVKREIEAAGMAVEAEALVAEVQASRIRDAQADRRVLQPGMDHDRADIADVITDAAAGLP